MSEKMSIVEEKQGKVAFFFLHSKLKRDQMKIIALKKNTSITQILKDFIDSYTETNEKLL